MVIFVLFWNPDQQQQQIFYFKNVNDDDYHIQINRRIIKGAK